MNKFYVDGSCKGNGTQFAEGGFGVVELDENNKVVSAYAKRNSNTTNNREELRAILYVMLTHGQDVTAAAVFSDSAYSVNTFTSWMFNWAKNGWIKSDKKVPENLDLIKAYYDLYNQGNRIDLHLVKGHAGTFGNELADKLATGELSVEEVLKRYG